MTTSTNITYTATKPAWSFWLGAGLTFGAIVTIGVLDAVSDAILWLI